MASFALAALLLAQAAGANPFDKFDPKPWDGYKNDPIVQPPQERLGPGPHTLVVSDGDAITRFEYRSGALCKVARDTVRRQSEPPPKTATMIYGPSRVKAYCVPR